MMKIESNQELLQKLQEAHRNDDRAEIERLEAEMIESSKAQLSSVEQSHADIALADVGEGKSDRKSNGDRRRRYNELIALYRRAMQLAKDISTTKKLMRTGKEELK